MKILFKKQAYQTAAVEAVADCFKDQPFSSGLTYRVDPGLADASPQITMQAVQEVAGFKNAEIAVPDRQLLRKIQAVQSRQDLPLSEGLDRSNMCGVNLDVEMETGTGKTYCYIKTMFEMNKRYGWTKFIVVVPSIAIREGVYKSFEITADHFLEEYGKRARFFIYNSKQLHNLESYSSDPGINVMIINVQAFNARGKDARRIHEELDDFQSRRPIDVIKGNRPILILDEPQRMEGKKTLESLREFNPLMILRYSATHKTQHNKVYRLDALDAYNQKLVKKIAVRGITVKGLAGTDGYLYLESIAISAGKPPVARVEMETKRKTGIKREVRRIGRNDNLHTLSGGLDQYQGYVVADIDAVSDTVSFTNGEELRAGEASGDVNESTLRQIQIREAIRAHFEKEQMLFDQGVKVLTLFFIDEVAKYRQYDESGEQPGEYARMFEEEYERQRDEFIGLFTDSPYARYLQGIETTRTHNGYFSIDKKSKRLVDPKVNTRGELAGEADDVDAYDLILKDKERLLSFAEPTRFIFSHSALREGWDNPNVFVIGTLKHSDSTISRLTVVANESYKDFVAGLQKDISESLSERPRVADEEYFIGKVLNTPTGDVPVTPQMAKKIYRYLVKNDYTDVNDRIAQAYHQAKAEEQLAELPEDLKPYADQVFHLIDSVFSDADLPAIDDDRAAKLNPLNANFQKKEFQELWKRINQKAAYTVHFDTNELVSKCVTTLDRDLRVLPLQYVVQRGEQKDETDAKALKKGQAFEVRETEGAEHKASVHSDVKYDLIGKLAEHTQLTRRTIAGILQWISKPIFDQYPTNPEDFILKAGRLINEQKATVIVEHLAYDPIDERHDLEIFTRERPKASFDKAVKANRHIYDYVFTDSKTEREFVGELDTSAEVVVYAKLPGGFFIPTPVGNYNPDWAIAFQEGRVKHIYFIAETKGSMSSLELREMEKSKIQCARKFFAKIADDEVKYDVIDGYDKLMELVA
jgi:type III restriction enzyme